MPLPKIEHPLFDIELPSNKQKIKVRPFLVKEEKILLMALQGEDVEEAINAIKQVINNCIVDENIDIDNLATIDIEYMFIKIRAKSINNIIKLTYKDLEDEKHYDVEVDLDKVEILRDNEHTNKIIINKNMGLYLKYPQASIAEKLKDIDNETDLFFDILKSCIDKIYDGENEYSTADSSDEELEEFIQSLDVKTFNKIQNFFKTMPRLHYKTSYVNSFGKEKNIILSKLNDFFTLG